MTVMGHHTAAELADMLAAKDHAHQGLSLAYEAVRARWAQTDPKAFSAFSDAYQANGHTYQEARDKAWAKAHSAYFDSHVPMNLYPTEDEYAALLAADRPTADAITPGDFYDLSNRVAAFARVAGITLPDAGPTPQPGKNSDAGLVFLRETEPHRLAAEAEAAAKAAGTAIGRVAGGLLGGTADGVAQNLTTSQKLFGAAAVGLVGVVALGALTRR